MTNILTHNVFQKHTLQCAITYIRKHTHIRTTQVRTTHPYFLQTDAVSKRNFNERVVNDKSNNKIKVGNYWELQFNQQKTKDVIT